MKKLILIRHAAASNASAIQQDKTRNLSELGRCQIKNVGLQLKQKKCFPDLLFCSPSTRTKETAYLLCQTLAINFELIKIDNIFYSGDIEDILNLLNTVENINQLFVIGHNPYLSWLAHFLCNATKHISLPPAAAIGLKLNVANWSKLKKEKTQLLFFIEPQNESD